MKSQPGGDTNQGALLDEQWRAVLLHRTDGDGSRQTAARRFAEQGIGPEQVRAVLADGGDALYAAAASGRHGWADAFGGPLAVALLSAEVGILAAHLNSRASGVRSMAVAELLDEYSAVTVAGELGVARQKVYEIARPGLRPPYIEQVPWRTT
ncbi:hypothetical protein [Paenarthrobacter ureafaciens]|jgi:hypothetical protein|uniref:hypothetical protein n=1 Tax=Paenarthrobacter ureafaciens TaxID=37931 RepID=UPI0019177137|nr:hypothetical protein [Paenarthrobacter ureafaciens]QQQ62224.1 hypothetical protein JHQ56_18695 [Paenarthrobacter ureafaciens]